MSTDPRDRPPHDGMVTKGEPDPKPPQPQPNAEMFYKAASAEQVTAMLNEHMEQLRSRLGLTHRVVIIAFQVEQRKGAPGREGTVNGMQFAADVTNHRELAHLLTIAAGVEQEEIRREQQNRIVRPGDPSWPGQQSNHQRSAQVVK